ncbi:MAG TPA: quinone oxidoreductase [Gemmatimonadaceae bacterium]|nr:quinone oxidoreductase [Gemmatimonadaceae bacterium]
MSSTGSADALQWVEADRPVPKADEALIRLEAIGVNFIDVYFREGRYKAPLPFIPGQEGAGTVLEIGAAVTDVRVGHRVAYTGTLGAYAEFAAVPADRLVRIPDGLGAREAAAAMLQGMTAHYLTRTTYPLRAGETALVHAAAGGVGLLLVQMAKRLGARVIATAGTEEKAALARGAGADHVIVYTAADFEPETKRLTGGRGVDVVYDGVGRDTFDRDLNVLRPRGMLVLYGGSSGAVPPFDPIVLSQKGSLFLTRPTLAHYIAAREELAQRASDVLGAIARGELRLRISRDYPLADAAQAHRDLEGRVTTGKLLLVP